MKRNILNVFLISFCLLLSSCAYMQTHKNVKESFCHYEGYKMRVPTQVIYANAKWYLETDNVLLRKHYPVIYDKILLNQNNEPSFYEITNVPHGTEKKYHEISTGTAKVLMKKDGYATMESLHDEMKSMNACGRNLASKSIRRYPIKGYIKVNKKDVIMAAERREPATVPVGASILGGITKVVVDWPGTLAYNVAIPFMAPVVFFKEFLSAD